MRFTRYQTLRGVYKSPGVPELLSGCFTPLTTTMTHNLTNYRTHLLQSKFYAANPSFLQSVGWRYDESGHVLADKVNRETAIVAVVGQVIQQRLDVGPEGNFLNGKFGSLATAKFTLQLTKQVGTVFANDYDKALEALSKSQNHVASTQDKRNLIVSDGQYRNLRFTRNVFEKRVRH